MGISEREDGAAIGAWSDADKRRNAQRASCCADFGLQELAERGGEILRIARGHAAGGLGDQRAVAVGGVGDGATCERAIERTLLPKDMSVMSS